MRILVTGANGLLGQKLVGLLSTVPGAEVIGTGRGPLRLPTFLCPGSGYQPLDITRPDETAGVLDRIRPDVVIHTAAMTQVDACELDPAACRQCNVEGTRNLLRGMTGSGSFFIYLSTDFVFNGEAGPYREDDPPHPLNEYGRSKLAAEQLVQARAMRWAIVRTVLVYGTAWEPSRSNIVLWVKRNLEAGKPIRVVTDQVRTPTLAEDLAAGVAAVARQGAEGIFHIAGPGTMTPYELAVRTARHFRLDESLISPTHAAEFRETGRRPLRTGFSIEKARKILGYDPRGLGEGLRLVDEQLQEQASGREQNAE
jgi:dTDP-4-dehydrorhamnose reductase